MADNSTPLTASESPTVTDPIPFRAWAGDHSDDDGRAIDDTLEAAFAPPVETEQAPSGVKEIKAVTRLISREMVFPAASALEPFMLLPPDVHRVSLLITTTHPGRIRVGQSAGDCKFGGLLIGSPLDLSNHTGAVWIYCADSTDAVTVSAFAVTN